MDKINLKDREQIIGTYPILWLNQIANIKIILAIFVMLHLSICNLYYSCNLAFIELINKLSLNFQLISVKQV